MSLRRADVITLALLGGCSSPSSMFAAAGPEARELASLFWLLLAITGLPALVYIAVAVLAAWRARRRDDGGEEPPPPLPPGAGTRWIVGAGGLVPVLIVAAALGVTLRSGARVDAARDDAELTIDVVGHQFWWEVLYPDEGIATANEIHVPVGVPVRLRLRSADVIHSFWIPRLAGKRDMTPGHVAELYLRADTPGVYRGQCYELCGVQHALMGFELIARERDELDAWLASQRELAEPPADPSAARGREVFTEAECDLCHMVRGLTPPGAMGSPGPDLTHFASRRTLGANRFPNTRGHLAGWILDPQGHKPGVRMPGSTLPAADLHALLDYLEGLE